MNVISGEREAYLGYLGVINTIASRDFVLFDLGGASVEVSLVRNGMIEQSVSVPIGAVTLTEKFDLSGNPDISEIEDCLEFIEDKMECLSFIKGTGLPLIGIGGTARAFAKMDQRLTGYEFPKIHNYILPKNILILYMIRSQPYRQVNEKNFPASTATEQTSSYLVQPSCKYFSTSLAAMN